MTISKRVRAELTATGQVPSLRALILRRGIGPSVEQRKALMAGRPVVFQTEWLASHYRETAHPAFPPSFGAAPALRLEADGNHSRPGPMNPAVHRRPRERLTPCPSSTWPMRSPRRLNTAGVCVALGWLMGSGTATLFWLLGS